MFCSSCGTSNDNAARFCLKCGTSLAAAPAGAVPPPAANATMRGGAGSTGIKQFAAGKNPAVALILSLIIIGVGQFYNGDVKKGLVMLVGTIVLGLATGGIAVLVFWIWSGFDAYQVASGKSALW